MQIRPFPITEKNVQKSPMKTIQNVKLALADYNAGKSIGFSRVSSLKSMGLLPRNDGFYKLGKKYC